MFTVLGGASTSADAQACGVDYYNRVVVCGPVLAYPADGFADAGAGAAGVGASVPANTAATNTGTTAGAAVNLAHTGVESEVLGYAGAGLLGFGCLAAATARRRTRNI